MRAEWLARLALITACVVLAAQPSPAGAHAEKDVAVGVGQSVPVDLPEEARDVVLSNPGVAEAIVRTSRTAFIVGQKRGRASAVFVAADGRRILTLNISVERDLRPAAALIRRLVPGSAIRLASAEDSIVLSGTVAAPSDAVRCADIAARFVESRDKVLNLIDVRQGEQVLLKVTVAEVSRTALRRIGSDILHARSSGGRVLAASQSAFTATGGLAEAVADAATGMLSPGNGAALLLGLGHASSVSASAVIQALERTGELRILAEPALTSVSGETANFLAGGEFPVPIGGEAGQPTIQFKPFGVGLAFTPVVLGEGRVSLKIATEVSELSTEGAVVSNGISVPGLKVRRASATVELAQGKSLVLAGMLSDTTRRSRDRLPMLADLPVIGELLGSRDFQNASSELVIIVTPHLVAGTDRQRLAVPTGGQQ